MNEMEGALERRIVLDIGAAMQTLQASPELAAMMAELVAPLYTEDLKAAEAEIERLTASLSQARAERDAAMVVVDAARIYTDAGEGVPIAGWVDRIDDAGWELAQAYRKYRGTYDAAVARTLPTYRASIIEECARIAEASIRFERLRDNEVCSAIAAAIRALGVA